MPEPGSLFWGMIFGSLGMGYFVYGKNQAKFAYILAGIGLCAYPYFVTSLWGTFLVGALFLAFPFLIKRWVP